jgi:hypothetical protein
VYSAAMYIDNRQEDRPKLHHRRYSAILHVHPPQEEKSWWFRPVLFVLVVPRVYISRRGVESPFYIAVHPLFVCSVLEFRISI